MALTGGVAPGEPRDGSTWGGRVAPRWVCPPFNPTRSQGRCLLGAWLRVSPGHWGGVGGCPQGAFSDPHAPGGQCLAHRIGPFTVPG